MTSAQASLDEQLGKACKAGKIAVVRELLRAGARPDSGEWPAIKDAVVGGNLGVLSCVLEAKPHQVARDAALRLAATCLMTGAVQMLFDSGAQVSFDPLTLFGSEGKQGEMRRMLVAHMMASRLQDAMGDGAPEVKTPAGAPSPL